MDTLNNFVRFSQPPTKVTVKKVIGLRSFMHDGDEPDGFVVSNPYESRESIKVSRSDTAWGGIAESNTVTTHPLPLGFGIKSELVLGVVRDWTDPDTNATLRRYTHASLEPAHPPTDIKVVAMPRSSEEPVAPRTYSVLSASDVLCLSVSGLASFGTLRHPDQAIAYIDTPAVTLHGATNRLHLPTWINQAEISLGSL